MKTHHAKLNGRPSTNGIARPSNAIGTMNPAATPNGIHAARISARRFINRSRPSRVAPSSIPMRCAILPDRSRKTESLVAHLAHSLGATRSVRRRCVVFCRIETEHLHACRVRRVAYRRVHCHQRIHRDHTACGRDRACSRAAFAIRRGEDDRCRRLARVAERAARPGSGRSASASGGIGPRHLAFALESSDLGLRSTACRALAGWYAWRPRVAARYTEYGIAQQGPISDVLDRFVDGDVDERALCHAVLCDHQPPFDARAAVVDVESLIAVAGAASWSCSESCPHC